MQPIDEMALAVIVDGGIDPRIHARGDPNALGTPDLDDPASVSAWCDRYDLTRDQLVAAIGMVGSMPAALSFYLTSRGRPTKRITDEMRALRGPILPRDRRRKIPAASRDETGCSMGEQDSLAQEKAVLESDLRVAADALHAHPCPATIHAYDDAQKRLEEVAGKVDATGLVGSPASRRNDATDAGAR